MDSKDARTLPNEPVQPPSAKAIVCLYAQSDEPFYHDLQTHLFLWRQKGYIRWLDLPAGVHVEETLLAYIHQADLILLLISSDFFVPRVCRTALDQAIVEHETRGVPVVPVLARASLWKESECGHLHALPENERPITEWEYQERAYEDISAGLARSLGLSPHAATLPGRPRLFQARDLPKGYVPRPKAFDEIKHLLLNQQDHQTTAITTALRGAGGFGKTTLALALCHDAEIQAAFPDGILWVELGEHPLRTLDVLNSMLAALEPSLSGAITLEDARNRWHRALHKRVCLLVIDDAWQAVALGPLLESGPRCTRLVTTRDDQVLPEEAARVWVDEMEPEEALAVLRRGIPAAIEHMEYEPALKALAKRLGHWPLLLTLAHGLLADQIRYGRTISQALGVVEQAYHLRGVTAFHLEQASERHQTVERCLDVSVHHLAEFTLARYQASLRYQELAIFPEDTNIPLATLYTFWQGTGGLESWETDELCVRLHQLSLLLTCDLRKGIIRLHDVLRSYLIQRAGLDLPALHAHLLDASWYVLRLKRWADLPSTEAYLWQHLILHLCQAGRRTALQATLTDMSYLTCKALSAGIPALEADFLLASTFSSEAGVEPAPSFFAPLHRRLVRIGHLLQQVRTPAEVGGLLLSYLGGEAAFAGQRFLLERELQRPFITPWHSLPRRSSSALMRTLHGHTELVNDCAVSADGRFIISASDDGTLKVWDAAIGAERLTLTGHTSEVYGCAVSFDGRFIVSASHDKTLKVWDAATGAERLTLTGHTDSVDGCAVSPDGRFIISTSWDRTLKVWDAVTGAECFTLTGHTEEVNSCAVSPDGRFIVSASHDQTLKVWDTTTGAERLTLIGHTEQVNGCAVSPDGRFIVSASDDQTLKVWNAVTGAERLTLIGHTEPVIGCVVSPDGRFIVSAASDETLKMWDATTGAERLTLTGHTDRLSDCAVSPDGLFIISASWDETLKVWDATTGAERLTLIGHTNIVDGCAVSPDSRFIVSASWDGTLKVWDATTGAERLTFTGHTEPVNGCAVSPDGLVIVSASDDQTLKVWDAATGAERLTLTGHTRSVNGCAVSPDGRFIISDSWDETLKVWDAATGAERLTLTGHTRSVNGCAVSPDSRFIVSASSDETLKVWDAATGAERLTLTGHTGSVNGCAVSPDGRFIISASYDQTLKVWNARTGQCMLTFPVDGALRGCAFHPDGKHLVSCGDLGMFFLQLMV